MSYKALYRKWRPQTFEDVIGQDHIIRTLKNQIDNHRIAHAYLFCGTRGTGKTSTAKIFAKTVNCLQPQEGNPCNQCERCLDFQEGTSMNVIEIDAASNNGVDNIREIREEVKYSPAKGGYKVYIIDEVHMLSTGAFNALLKTLEEPPAHIIFILATTDPQKIPPTILSRCQRFDFRRVSMKDMTNQLKKYMKTEGVNIEDRALSYIASIADGSMRDSLSILDQCISFYFGEEITLEKVLQVLGAVDNRVYYDMTQSLIEQDTRQCIEWIQEVQMQGRDLTQFVLGLIQHFRNLLIVRATDHSEEILNLSKEETQKLQEQGKNIKGNTLLRYIRVFSELESQMKYASQKKILLEVAVMKLCQPMLDQSSDALLDRIQQLEKKLAQGIRVVAQSAPASSTAQGLTNNTTPSISTNIVSQAPPAKPKAVPQEVKKAVDHWNDFKLKFTGPLGGLLKDVEAGYIEGDTYYLICPHHLLVGELEKRKHMIQEELEKTMGKSLNIKIVEFQQYQSQYQDVYGFAQGEEVEAESSVISDKVQKMIHHWEAAGIPVHWEE
ncbi:MAG: DNA polymerase III subunit gamma/tau [Epulopiscium sp.]|nr:DNA polymerase III subunit gamma/tau [Candidatus Epulonipiscium sp.]